MNALTLLLLFVTSIAFSQIKSNNDLKKMNLKGKVKSIAFSGSINLSHNFHKVAPHVLKDSKPYTSKIIFNKFGHIIYAASAIEKIKYNQMFKNSYDSNNNVIETVCYSVKAIGKKVKRKVRTDIDSATFVNKYFYNDKSQLTSALMNANLTNVYVLTYEYDKQGNEILIKRYDSVHVPNEKHLASKAYFTYDKNGNVLTKEYFNKNDLRDNIEGFEYDENNNVAVNTYDYFNGFNNNNEKQPMYWSAPTKTYTYVVDNKKNWISMTEYINDKVVYRTTREIKYY